jgi:hypothetical protein
MPIEVCWGKILGYDYFKRDWLLKCDLGLTYSTPCRTWGALYVCFNCTDAGTRVRKTRVLIPLLVTRKWTFPWVFRPKRTWSVFTLFRDLITTIPCFTPVRFTNFLTSTFNLRSHSFGLTSIGWFICNFNCLFLLEGISCLIYTFFVYARFSGKQLERKTRYRTWRRDGHL